MKPLFAVIIISLSQIGCTSSYIVSSSTNEECLSTSEFNSSVLNQKTEIVFNDGSLLNVQLVWTESDSIFYVHPLTSKLHAVPIQEIKKITYLSHGRGALEGTGIGLVSGGAVGFLSAAIVTKSTNDPDPYVFIGMPILGGLLGLLTGPIVGVVSGHTYEYKFVHELKKPLEDTTSHYTTHVSLMPEEGYGLIVGSHIISHRTIYELGAARVSRLENTEGTFLESFFSFEVNVIRSKPVFAFVGGAVVKGTADAGLAVNYMSNFTGLRGLLIRPQIGFSLIPGGNVHASFEYELPIWQPNFRIVNKMIFGIRYTIGLLQKRNTN